MREKTFNVILCFIGISIISILPFFFVDKIYVNDDFLFHKTRILAYYSSLVFNNDFHPMIFYNMNNGFGYAADLFYPSYILLPFFAFYCFGFGFIRSYYLLFFIYTFLTLLVGYATAKHFFNDTRTAFVAAISYGCGTYRMIDLYVRGDLGEVGAYIFLPLVMLGLYMIYRHEKYAVVVLALGLGLITNIHPMTTLLCIYVIAIINGYVLFCHKSSIYFIRKQAIAYILAFAFSAVTVFPILEQICTEKFNFMAATSLWNVGLNFSFAKLINGSLANNAGVWENISPNIGPLMLMFILIAIFRYKTSSLRDRNVLIATCVSLIGSTNLLLWPILKNTWFANIQFEWRLLIFATLFGSVIVATIGDKLSRKSIILLVILFLVLMTSFNFNVFNNLKANPRGVVLTNESVLTFDTDSIGGGRDYLPQNIDLKKAQKGSIVSNISGVFDFSKEHTVVFRRIYYKGYVVHLNDGQDILTYSKNGYVAAKIRSGRVKYSLIYKKTQIQQLGMELSSFSWVLFSILMLVRVMKKVRRKLYGYPLT